MQLSALFASWRKKGRIGIEQYGGVRVTIMGRKQALKGIAYGIVTYASDN
jgi:hypothetical protein